jgi:hypothetical protein
VIQPQVEPNVFETCFTKHTSSALPSLSLSLSPPFTPHPSRPPTSSLPCQRRRPAPTLRRPFAGSRRSLSSATSVPRVCRPLPLPSTPFPSFCARPIIPNQARSQASSGHEESSSFSLSLCRCWRPPARHEDSCNPLDLGCLFNFSPCTLLDPDRLWQFSRRALTDGMPI